MGVFPIQILTLICQVFPIQKRQRKHQPTGSLSINQQAVETLCCGSISRSESKSRWWESPPIKILDACMFRWVSPTRRQKHKHQPTGFHWLAYKQSKPSVVGVSPLEIQNMQVLLMGLPSLENNSANSLTLHYQPTIPEIDQHSKAAWSYHFQKANNKSKPDKI